MKREFVPYEQALELRTIGFDEECIMYYSDSLNGYTLKSSDYWYSNSHWMFNADDNKDRHLMCTAPLYQQAFRWFREEYSTSQYVQKFETKFFCCVHDGNSWSAETFDTYEEAELACIKKLIEIAKNK